MTNTNGNFELDLTKAITAFCYPCVACKHRDKRDYTEPCNTCSLNANLERDPSPQPSLKAPKNADQQECVWTENGRGSWDLCSGNTYEFYNGGPAENGFKFCPYCGKQVKEQYKETDDAEM
jgi:hypothetical protein